MKIYNEIYNKEIEENTINGGGFMGFTAPAGIPGDEPEPEEDNNETDGNFVKKSQEKILYEFYNVDPMGGQAGGNLNYGIMGGTFDGLNLGSPTINGHRYSSTGDHYNLDSNLPTSGQPGANDRENYDTGGYTTRLYYLIDANTGAPLRQASREEWEESQESKKSGNQGIITVAIQGEQVNCYVTGEET